MSSNSLFNEVQCVDSSNSELEFSFSLPRGRKAAEGNAGPNAHVREGLDLCDYSNSSDAASEVESDSASDTARDAANDTVLEGSEIASGPPFREGACTAIADARQRVEKAHRLRLSRQRLLFRGAACDVQTERATASETSRSGMNMNHVYRLQSDIYTETLKHRKNAVSKLHREQ